MRGRVAKRLLWGLLWRGEEEWGDGAEMVDVVVWYRYFVDASKVVHTPYSNYA